MTESSYGFGCPRRDSCYWQQLPSVAHVSLSTVASTQSETERLYHKTTQFLGVAESDDEVRLVYHSSFDAQRISRAFEEVLGFFQQFGTLAVVQYSPILFGGFFLSISLCV